MTKTEILQLNKTSNLPSFKKDGWDKLLLSRLLTEISVKRGGSIYAESEGDFVEFRVTQQKEKMLNKGSEYKVITKNTPSILNRFITYINKDIFKLSPSSMCAGILEVKFDCEDRSRLYTVYSRRSGAMGDFIQIDQFNEHL